MEEGFTDIEDRVRPRGGNKGRLAPQRYTTYRERKRGKDDQTFNEKAYNKLRNTLFPGPTTTQRIDLLTGLLETNQLKYMNIPLLADVIRYMNLQTADVNGHPRYGTREFIELLTAITNRELSKDFSKENEAEQSDLLFMRLQATFIRYVNFVNNARKQEDLRYQQNIPGYIAPAEPQQIYVQTYAQPYTQPYAQPYAQPYSQAYTQPYTQPYSQTYIQPSQTYAQIQTYPQPQTYIQPSQSYAQPQTYTEPQTYIQPSQPYIQPSQSYIQPQPGIYKL